jgi:hypothetical protein
MIDVEENIIPLLFLAFFEKSRKQRAQIQKMSQCLEPPFPFELDRFACSSNPKRNISL